MARVKDRRTVTVRDLPAAGVPVVIRWRKRIFECRYVLCSNKTWTEQHPSIAPRAVLTDRARQWGFEQVGRHDRAVAPVAAVLGVGWHTVMRQVHERGNPLVDDPERLAGVSAVGVDETAFLRACSTHPTLYATGIVDLTPGRPARCWTSCRAARAPSYRGGSAPGTTRGRAQIVTASLDPFRGYATALAAQLTSTVRVLDAFHLVKLALTCVDEVRRRTQQDTLGHRGFANDPLFRPAGCCAGARTGSRSSNARSSSRRCWPVTRTTK